MAGAPIATTWTTGIICGPAPPNEDNHASRPKPPCMSHVHILATLHLDHHMHDHHVHLNQVIQHILSRPQTSWAEAARLDTSRHQPILAMHEDDHCISAMHGAESQKSTYISDRHISSSTPRPKHLAHVHLSHHFFGLTTSHSLIGHNLLDLSSPLTTTPQR